MQKKLTTKDYIYIASMLFGLFFGAGNLIFPVFMGQMAGNNIWYAILGFLVTGVGLPLLGIVAMGISKSNGLYSLGSRIHPYYSVFFTCALYLTIGPFFAIPRTATVSFEVGIAPLLSADQISLWLGIFSFLFFISVLWFSLKPSKILVYVGKVLNPLFLFFLSILIITAFINPMGDVSQFQATGAYQDNSFFQGFIEGYNTMDALASLAFGIIVINVIKGLGVEDPKAIAVSTVKSGILSMSLMAIIYGCLAIIGTQSLGITEISKNGGQALSIISTHYFGKGGAFLLAVIITLACLKTAVGLITACSETFSNMFKNSLSYKAYTVLFCTLSFAIANIGLNNIISFSIPVLMFLYPLAISLILLSIFDGAFKGDRRVYQYTIGFTVPAAILDLIGALPKGIVELFNLGGIIEAAKLYLPFYSIGMGWILPSISGLLIGLLISKLSKK
ncbi:MAG: branched-chain amino acid transport system II carrier protein [Tissierellaceae bacterium]|nr:branched-chain amino acid transport system II carrier protein [Tissierellaceae bacterium]